MLRAGHLSDFILLSRLHNNCQFSSLVLSPSRQGAFDGIHHNNQMESFNGNTVRSREKVVRGIKKDDSPVLKGMQIHHNFIRPHQSLDGDAQADRAGIRIEGNNKWKSIIQNTSTSLLDLSQEELPLRDVPVPLDCFFFVFSRFLVNSCSGDDT